MGRSRPPHPPEKRIGRFPVFAAVAGSALARSRGACYGGAVFGVGTWEMVVIAIVAMLLFKPTELPKMLRSASRLWGQLRATADEFRDTIMTADGVDELTEMVRGTQAELRGIEGEARREMMKARAQMRRAQQKLALTHKARQEREQASSGTLRDATPPAVAPAAPAAAATPTPPAQVSPAPATNDVNQGAA